MYKLPTFNPIYCGQLTNYGSIVIIMAESVKFQWLGGISEEKAADAAVQEVADKVSSDKLRHRNRLVQFLMVEII